VERVHFSIDSEETNRLENLDESVRAADTLYKAYNLLSRSLQ